MKQETAQTNDGEEEAPAPDSAPAPAVGSSTGVGHQEDTKAAVGSSLSALELERLDNIRWNQEYLASLGLSDTKAQIGLTSQALLKTKEARKAPSSRGLKPAKRYVSRSLSVCVLPPIQATRLSRLNL